MKMNHDDKKFRIINVRLGLMFLIFPLIPVVLWRSWENGGESGQFAKFLAQAVLSNNLFGIFFILLGIGLAGFIAFRVVTKKAFDPKKAVLYAIPLCVFFVGVGAVLSKDLNKNVAAVKNYITGNIVEERVVITNLKVYSNNRGDDGYEYTFSDGRTFYENHQGEGFGDITAGRTYIIRYLPNTPKLLSIKLVE